MADPVSSIKLDFHLLVACVHTNTSIGVLSQQIRNVYPIDFSETITGKLLLLLNVVESTHATGPDPIQPTTVISEDVK